MTDSLTSLCDTFVTNSSPTIQRNIPSKRRNCLAKRHFSQFPFACGFWRHQKNWLSWGLHPCWQTEWHQSRVYVRTLQVFCFCLTHLDHFRMCKTKTRRRDRILKLLWKQDSTIFDSIKVISWRISALLIQKGKWHGSFNGHFQRKTMFFLLYYILAAGKKPIRYFRQCFGIWSQHFPLTMTLQCNDQKSTQYTTPRISSSWEWPHSCSLL